MNADFRLAVGIFTHPKIIKLGRKLGDHGILSWLRLLAFAAQGRTDGTLAGMDSEDIAIAAGFNGEANELIETLTSFRMLDREGDALVIHDWPEHNPWVYEAEKRSEAARKAINARWEKRRNTDEQGESFGGNTPVQKTATNVKREKAIRNTPLLSSPIPSFPNLSSPVTPPNPLTGEGADAPDVVPFESGPFPVSAFDGTEQDLGEWPQDDQEGAPDASQVSLVVSGKSEASTGRVAKSRGLSPAPKPRQIYPEEFETLWASHIGPRKGVGKAEACKAWKKAIASGATAEEIAEGHARYLRSEAWAKDGGEFIPGLEPWLNQRRWEDDPAPRSTVPQVGGPGPRPGFRTPQAPLPSAASRQDAVMDSWYQKRMAAKAQGETS